MGSRMKQDPFDSNSASYHQLTPNVQEWKDPKSPVSRTKERVMWHFPAFTGRHWLSFLLSIMREKSMDMSYMHGCHLTVHSGTAQCSGIWSITPVFLLREE